ncbi:MAG: DUF1684 domain-containing protein [Polyangiaceae bacterium]
MNIIKHMRQDKDFFFRTDPDSPIPEEERESFTGLSYFPYNDDLCFALDLDKFLWSNEVMIPTSAGEEAGYVRHGRIKFKVGGQEQTLTVFRSEHGLFMPFHDATSGVDTYEGGRYLEPDIDVTGKILVDFNLAYNPFCAYGGSDWSCPIPPPENRLAVRIEAGEKKYR